MKKNKLALALAATLGLGAVATSVQAVNLAENGVGEYSIIPYFSVTKGQNEFINIVNTSNKTVAAKIVFRRGTDSIEARDFVIVMSPKDVWTGYIAPGIGGNAKLVTSDRTCTVPDKLAPGTWTAVAGSPNTYEVPFDAGIFGNSVTLASNWVASAPIGTGSTPIASVQEGYVTVAVMGVQDRLTSPFVGYFSEHVGGVPRNCGIIASTWTSNLPQIQGQFTQAENVLRVTAIMVDGAANLATAIPVTSMANVFNNGQPAAAAGSGLAAGASADGINNIYPSSIDFPNETFTNPTTANVYESNSAAFHSVGFVGAGSPEQAFSAALMNDSIYGTYDTTTTLKSSWVVNFPTKRSHQVSKTKPYTETCVPISTTFWDNEEGIPQGQAPGQLFSPATPPPVVAKKLCYEVNVVDFNNKNPLSSKLAFNSGVTFPVGWMQLSFAGANLVGNTVGNTPATTTLSGMPVIGFEYFETGGFSAANSLGYSKFISRP